MTLREGQQGGRQRGREERERGEGERRGREQCCVRLPRISQTGSKVREGVREREREGGREKERERERQREGERGQEGREGMKGGRERERGREREKERRREGENSAVSTLEMDQPLSPLSTGSRASCCIWRGQRDATYPLQSDQPN